MKDALMILLFAAWLLSSFEWDQQRKMNEKWRKLFVSVDSINCRNIERIDSIKEILKGNYMKEFIVTKHIK